MQIKKKKSGISTSSTKLRKTQALRFLLSSFIKQEDRVKQQEAITQMAIINWSGYQTTVIKKQKID